MNNVQPSKINSEIYIKGGEGVEDKKIVDLFLRRIEQAITETDIKYGELCSRIARNLLFNREDAKEIVNDTYLGIWNSIPPHKPVYLMPFVCRITKNKAMDRLDYNNAQKRNSNMEMAFEELEDIVSKKSSVEDEYEVKEIAGYISEFLKRESYQKRAIFIRRYWYMDSIQQIAEEFRLSESNVKSSLFRMREKLKKYLIERGVEV